MRDLFRGARRLFTPLLLGLGDRVARRWLERSRSPYLNEIDEIAALLPGKGAYALNTSYEWCCTSGVGDDPDGGIRLIRVLDWWQSGLGRNLVLAWQTGPAGDFINITWPGFAGVMTAMAPGRFAVSLNQPPRMRRALTPLGDWVFARADVWRSRALPPAHLLRMVCETCVSFAEARSALHDAPLCIPALFTIVGTAPGEGCIIERAARSTALRNIPAAAANHWVGIAERGRPRGLRSRERQRQMERTLAGGEDWLGAPIINRHTRLVAVMNPAGRRLWVQGWERAGPATAIQTIGPH